MELLESSGSTRICHVRRTARIDIIENRSKTGSIRHTSILVASEVIIMQGKKAKNGDLLVRVIGICLLLLMLLWLLNCLDILPLIWWSSTIKIPVSIYMFVMEFAKTVFKDVVMDIKKVVRDSIKDWIRGKLDQWFS